MHIITLLLTITLSFNTLADCPSHKSMVKGDQAPCQGHFLNQNTNERVKKDLRDYKLTLEQLDLTKDMVLDLEQDRAKWAKEAHEQAKLRHDSQNDLRNGFIAGIVLTLGILLGVSK